MTVAVDARVRQFIEAHRVAHLATVGARGRPTVVPICYVFDGRSFYSPIDEKPKRVAWRRLRRLRNIRANPHVSLVIDRYAEDWTELAFALVHGRAKAIEPTGRSAREHAAAVSLLRDKYVQYRSMALDERPVIKIVPLRITFWSAAGRARLQSCDED